MGQQISLRQVDLRISLIARQNLTPILDLSRIPRIESAPRE
jgi:hypothetical protein